jgi:phosphoglycerol transferase MdoB-like AlkP superfamily enzyme
VAAYLDVDAPDQSGLNFARHRAGRAGRPGLEDRRRPNIVIIVAESLSHFKTSFAPGPDNPTPFIKELAGRSRYYPNYYANARTTARGVFSLLTGIPDVTGSSTGSRNPLVANQRVVADQFQGYDKYYLLGGNTGWANIRGVLGNNIQGLQILEESFWKSPNADVWGVSDLDMLREAQAFFSARNGKNPFLAVIQLSSFHRPYTVPDDIPGFARRELTEATRLNYGFTGEDEYNSMRLMDFSIAEFLRLAAAEPWFKDTIFVIIGDHGIRDSNRNMNDSYEAAQLGPWHVPLIIYSPGRIAPAVDEKPASHLDVFPTVAGLAGIDYTNWTLGRDLMDGRFAGSRAAFVSGNGETPIRLVRDGYCYLDNRVGQEALYKLDDASGADYRELEPERFAEMRELARAMQTTAKYMLYNNRK